MVQTSLGQKRRNILTMQDSSGIGVVHDVGLFLPSVGEPHLQLVGVGTGFLIFSHQERLKLGLFCLKVLEICITQEIYKIKKRWNLKIKHPAHFNAIVA